MIFVLISLFNPTLSDNKYKILYILSRVYIYRLDNDIWSRILLGYIHAQRLLIQNIQVQFIIQNRYYILDIEACRICTLAILSNTSSQIECCIKTFVDNEAYRQEYRNINAINKQLINVDPDIINSLTQFHSFIPDNIIITTPVDTPTDKMQHI